MISRDVCITNPGDLWGVGWGPEPSDGDVEATARSHVDWGTGRGPSHLEPCSPSGARCGPMGRAGVDGHPEVGQDHLLETDLRMIWVPGLGRLIWLSECPGPRVHTGAAELVLEAPGRWHLSFIELGTGGRPRSGTWGRGKGGFTQGRQPSVRATPPPLPGLPLPGTHPAQRRRP